MNEEEVSVADIIEFLNTNRRKIAFILFVVAVLVLASGVYKFIKHKKCEDVNGFMLTTGKCYFPENEWERKEFEEKGYLYKETLETELEEQLYLLNLTGGKEK